MIPDQTLLRIVFFPTWVIFTGVLWLGGFAKINKLLEFTPDPLASMLLAPLLALVGALILCFLIGLAMAHSGKQSAYAYDQAGRVAKMYSSLTGNPKPVPVEYDPFYEPSPTRPSEIYREYDHMRAAIASYIRAGDDTMTKAQQLKRYTELGGVPSDYLYQSPRRLRKVKEKSST